jgi:hypothetical protein
MQVDGYVAKPANRLLLVALAAWAVTLVVGIPMWLQGDVTSFRGGKPAGPVVKEDLNKVDPKVFTSSDGRFSAEFPSTPVRTVAKTTTSDGTELKQVNFSSTTEHGAVVVKYMDFEGTGNQDAVRVLLDVGPSMAVKDGKVTSREFVSVGEHSAVDFAVETSDKEKLLGRVVVVGAEDFRMYTLIAGPVDVKESKAAYERLIKTFTLEG